MGYSTDFKGELKFTNELKASEISKVNSFLGEDCRDHPEWGEAKLFFVDLDLLPDFSGLKWSGAEKTYGMVEVVNMLMLNVQIDFPSFGLEGKLLAQGEDIDDRWELVIENGVAVKRDIPQTGQRVECPHCEGHFYL